MTVLGAVSAGGGGTISSSSVILRADAAGNKVEIQVDLSAIQEARCPVFGRSRATW